MNSFIPFGFFILPQFSGRHFEMFLETSLKNILPTYTAYSQAPDNGDG